MTGLDFMTLRNTPSSFSSVSSAPNSRAASRKRSNCGFSSAGRGLRAGISWGASFARIMAIWQAVFNDREANLEPPYPVVFIAAFGAHPPFPPPRVVPRINGGTTIRHPHCSLSAVRTSLGWLLAECGFKHGHSQFQRGDPSGQNGPASQKADTAFAHRNPTSDKRPFCEGHHA